MKRLFFTLLAFAPILSAAQEAAQPETLKILDEAAEAVESAPKVEVEATPKPKYWKNSLQTKLDFGQTSLTNWAAGGYNSYSLKAYIDGNANYAKDNISWTNRLQLDYGFLYSADKPVLQKSDDRIYLESKSATRPWTSFSYPPSTVSSLSFPIHTNILLHRQGRTVPRCLMVRNTARRTGTR